MTFSVTPLGTAAPHPLPGRPCSGYLVRAGGATVWMDAGPGTFAELQRHVHPGELSAIWISHLHSDHWADLIAAEAGISDGGLRTGRPIPVYAPAAAPGRLAGFYGKPELGPLADVFAFHALADGATLTLGGAVLVSHAVPHGIEAYGARITYEGAVLAYTGDSGPGPELTQLAQGADLLLAEAYLDRHGPGLRLHLTPEDAGGLARAAGPRELLVSHVGPGLTPAAAASRAAAVFGGPTGFAREGVTYDVGNRQAQQPS
ncbi:MBL fold metallo-hydrolase [Streptomyces indicus]|uniref:Ribonuclease BN, tRNA processing enzyme n=1 Tax=Streptomyces indicus TaxID=417292 RepID=A0A1G9FFA8_9ACTN|nr:MBL fold metallo-hydrolase [Streptomyces indicus]SDK87049.1 Ribonuclease BN, tRNA processing enzyme [Streptomyces indicus]